MESTDTHHLAAATTNADIRIEQVLPLPDARHYSLKDPKYRYGDNFCFSLYGNDEERQVFYIIDCCQSW
jgi:hypothetical protein